MANAPAPEMVGLKFAQQDQILNEYRGNIYNAELRFNLLIKLLEEKGILLQEELNKRWPMYLEHDVGAIDGQTGQMQGSLKIHMYGI